MLHWPGLTPATPPGARGGMKPAARSDVPDLLPEIDTPLHAEQVRLLFRFSLVGYLATLLVIFILGAILWQDLARPALFLWFVAVSLVAVARYLLYKAFIRRVPPASEMRMWEQRFLVGSVFAALCWMAI